MEPGNFQYLPPSVRRFCRGRGFVTSDDAPGAPVVVVSESVARRFWPDQNGIGRRLRLTPDPTPGVPKSFYAWRTVVGVASDTRFRALRETSPTVYLPWQQWGYWPGTVLAVRSLGGHERACVSGSQGAARGPMDELLGGSAVSTRRRKGNRRHDWCVGPLRRRPLSAPARPAIVHDRRKGGRLTDIARQAP